MAACAAAARGVEAAVCGVRAVWQEGEDCDGELSGQHAEGGAHSGSVTSTLVEKHCRGVERALLGTDGCPASATNLPGWRRIPGQLLTGCRGPQTAARLMSVRAVSCGMRKA
jgi:hypothetical protein